MQKGQKRMHIMPNIERKNSAHIFHRHESMSVNVKIIIIIAIFSLILVSIATLILLSSYNPHATTLNTHQLEQQTTPHTVVSQLGITLPSTSSKTNLTTLQNQLASFTTHMASDEQSFENLVK